MKKFVFLLVLFCFERSFASLMNDQTEDPFTGRYEGYKQESEVILTDFEGAWPSFKFMKSTFDPYLDPSIKDDFLLGLSFLYQLGVPKHPGNVVTQGFRCLLAKVLYAWDEGGETGRAQLQKRALLQLLAFHKSSLEALQKKYDTDSQERYLLNSYLEKMPKFPCKKCKKLAAALQYDVKNTN